MLITFSGIVGGGKSTNAKQAHRLLQEAGYPVVYFRFRFLTWRRFFQPLPERKKPPMASPSPEKKKVNRPLRRRPMAKLTLVRALGYFWRILIFRIFAAVRLRRKIVILDRFYYDNFVHHALRGKRERFYFLLLKKILPVPNLALILIARPPTILRRRPHYDGDYLQRLYRHYTRLTQEFSNLILIRTDGLNDLTAVITQHVGQAIARERLAKPLLREAL